MVRSANMLWLVLTAAPVAYLAIGAQIALAGGFGANPTFVRVLFFALALVSATNVALTVFLQSGDVLLKPRVRPDPVGRTFVTMMTGSTLSEAHSIYGLVLTLFSGSIYYGVGFSLVSWASLFWTRQRFKQNLGKLPDDQTSSTRQP